MEIVRTIGKSEARVVADFILKNYGPMSHLKLQKLLYYCQAYHLGYFKEPLFDEDFQAWMHGPVCREVYNALKGESILHSDIRFSGSNNPDEELFARISSEQKDLVLDVLKELADWTGFELENATHKESPWINARKGYSPADRCEEIISKDSMRIYYSAELNVQST